MFRASPLSTFEHEAPSKSSVSGWYREFKRGRTSLTDKFSEGAPKTAVVPESIEAVRKMIKQDPHTTYREIEAYIRYCMKI